MRSPRVLTISATAFAAVLIGTGIPAKAATTVHYVALGDSYSSGVGAGSTSGSCSQTFNAYPALWAAANSPASFTFAACSGATTSDVISSQLSSLNSSTTLVSISIGGNDVGFPSIMETCVLGSTSSCESAVSAAESYANNTLPGQLNTMLADIHAGAPNAKVIILLRSVGRAASEAGIDSRAAAQARWSRSRAVASRRAATTGVMRSSVMRAAGPETETAIGAAPGIPTATQRTPTSISPSSRA